MIQRQTTDNYCCIRQDGTRFNIQCAFNFSDNLVIINQVTPVTTQNKNHIEINTNKNTNKIDNMVKNYQGYTFNTI